MMAVLLAAGCLGIVTPGPAAAAGAHRALVVVDTGSTTYRQVVTFDGDSVTGLQALQLAGANPVVYSYAGQGGAVCRLFGVGRDAGPNCLGGADGDNRYWAYFRAPSGTSSFTYSRSGAGSVPVHDGDVEGWKFATGEAPSWSAVPPTPTATLATPPPTVPTRVGSVTGPINSGAGPTPSVVDPNAALATSTTTDPSANGAATDVRGAQVEQHPTGRVASGPVTPSGGGDGGGAGSLAIFAIVAAALGAGVLYLRRVRRSNAG
jgi:hypothetical protein